MVRFPITALRGQLAAAILLSAINLQPALAQVSGDSADYVTATPAGRLTRYYAPYALQAAAAYKDVTRLDATLRGEAKKPPLDGSDVQVAVEDLAPGKDPNSDADLFKRAGKYLQSWQYQFGHQGYLRCFEDDADCQKAIAKDRWTLAIPGGPAFHVWARTRYPQKDGAACSQVSIAFRGTTPSFADWVANLDPVTGYLADDHYRQLRRNIDAIIKKITTLDCYKRDRTQIVAVGHSLGAGLAQFAGLSNNPSRPRITKVFAFDPTPVIAASYVDKALLTQNAGSLEIDRVYQSGEALQRLRSRYEQFPKSNSPCVRTVVFDVLRPAGSVTLHNMNGLAREVVRFSYDDETQAQNPYRVPKRLVSCPSNYQAPSTDEDQPDLVASAPDRSATRLARHNRNRTTNAFAAASPFGIAPAAAGNEATTQPKEVGLKSLKRSGRVAGKHEAKVSVPTEQLILAADQPHG